MGQKSSWPARFPLGMCVYSFLFIAGNEIKVVKDLAYEFSNTYKDIEVCVADRRDHDCTTFSIRLGK